MSRSDDIQAVFSERLTLSATFGYVGVTALPGQLAVTVKLLSGGTLEIGGQSQTHGSLAPLAVGESISFDCSGKFYLYATGATCVVSVLRGRTAGDWS